MKRAKSYRVAFSTASTQSSNSEGDLRELPDKQRRSSWFSGLGRARSNHTAVTTSLEEDIIDLSASPTYNFATLRELGMHEMGMGRYNEAIDCFTQALEEREEPLLRYYLLKLHLESEEEEDANKEYIKLQPYLDSLDSFPSPNYRLLEFFIKQEEWRASVMMGKELKYQDMGKLYYCHGIWLNEQDSLKKCLLNQPSPEIELLALNALVLSSQASGRHIEALRYHDRRFPLLATNAEKGKALYEQAESFVALRRLDKAEKSLNEGLDVLPRSSNLLQAKANLFLLNGKVEEACALFEHASQQTKIPSEKTKILYTLGRLAAKRSERELACQYFEQELEVTKQAYGDCHLELSRIYHELARMYDDSCDFAKAIEFLQEALKVEQYHLRHSNDASRPEISNLMRETQKFMGKIYFKSGDFERAMGTINQNI